MEGNRPTRRQPSFGVLLGGPLGLLFMRSIGETLGGDLAWEALGRGPAGQHVFRLRGSRAAGLLVEAAAQPAGEIERYEWCFLAPLPEDLVVVAGYRAGRWDPWLAAAQTGDHRLIDGPVGEICREEDRRNADLARTEDRLDIRFLPAAAAPPTLLGIPTDLLEAAAPPPPNGQPGGY